MQVKTEPVAITAFRTLAKSLAACGPVEHAILRDLLGWVEDCGTNFPIYGRIRVVLEEEQPKPLDGTVTMVEVWALLGFDEEPTDLHDWDAACYALESNHLPAGGWEAQGMVERLVKLSVVEGGSPHRMAAESSQRWLTDQETQAHAAGWDGEKGR